MDPTWCPAQISSLGSRLPTRTPGWGKHGKLEGSKSGSPPFGAVLGVFWPFFGRFGPVHTRDPPQTLSQGHALQIASPWAPLQPLVHVCVPLEGIFGPFLARFGPQNALVDLARAKMGRILGWVSQKSKTRARFPLGTPHFEWFPPLRWAPSHSQTPKPVCIAVFWTAVVPGPTRWPQNGPTQHGSKNVKK